MSIMQHLNEEALIQLSRAQRELSVFRKREELTQYQIIKALIKEWFDDHPNYNMEGDTGQILSQA